MPTAIQMIQMLISVPPHAEVVVLEPRNDGTYEYAEAEVWIVSDSPIDPTNLVDDDRMILISTFEGFQYATEVMGKEFDGQDED